MPLIALAASLLLALTVIPVATSFALTSASHHDPLLIRAAQRVYAPALGWALGNERKVILAAIHTRICKEVLSELLPRPISAADTGFPVSISTLRRAETHPDYLGSKLVAASETT